MKNKKGAEMTVGTIIIILLALVVLVVLIYGFTTGWTNLWEKITGFGGGSANVQTVVQSCQLACTTASEYDWCTKQRNVVFDKDTKETLKCEELVSKGVGLSVCTSVSCPSVTTEKSCKGSDACSEKTSETECLKVTGCTWE